jgi:hypothetical protein
VGVSRGNWRQQQKTSWNKTDKSPEAAGLRGGFRSGLEELNAKHLAALGVAHSFETLMIPYTVPETRRRYTPDFPLPNGVIIETKGKLEPKDRAKHILIKLQHPDLDIRFVFQRPHDKIVKGSMTTYAMWADKHGFKWAVRIIPEAWVREEGPARSPEDVLGIKKGPAA